ncbi:MAG: MBL fold metallo-hydrolase [Leptolyngbya sp. RL_3_1]|nr:MBL fold metallo-hydrolase [Leptolyngbya sp. RL_3_1]
MPDSDSPSLTQMPISTASTAAALSDHTGFTAQFWGVRGSVPTPGLDTVRYGGNTACVEVLAGETRLIFDGGTGLRVLGKHLLHQKPDIKAHLFFTHAHWDRIQGFPFFIPAFVPGNSFNIYGSPAPNGASIKQCLTDQMLRPNFFTPLQKMQAKMQFHNIHAGSVVPLGEGLTIETIALNPHTSALGFRINWQGHSLVYATDTEPHSRQLDQNLLYLAQDADLLIYDGTYADTAYHDLNGDGNMAWESGINLVKEAAIKELILFHHNPAHDDDFLDRMEMEIRQHFGNVRLAREGMILQLA